MIQIYLYGVQKLFPEKVDISTWLICVLCRADCPARHSVFTCSASSPCPLADSTFAACLGSPSLHRPPPPTPLDWQVLWAQHDVGSMDQTPKSKMSKKGTVFMTLPSGRGAGVRQLFL